MCGTAVVSVAAPYGLVFHSGRWYAVGHDHRSGEIRSFRADRIGAITPTGRRFTPAEGFDPVEHLNRHWATRGYRWQVEVLIEMAQMLAGLGRPFTVLAPDELRPAMAEYAARLTEWSARSVQP